MEKNFVLASFNPAPRAWNFYATEEDAWKDAPRAETYGVKYDHVVTFDEFLRLRNEHYTSQPLKEITAAHFDDMLNCLPPLAWGNDGSFEHFCMSEFTDGSITAMFVRCNGRFFTRHVDYRDKTTWITRQECLSYMLANPA